MKTYFPVLDGIRGIAAVAVMIRHMQLFFGEGVGTIESYLAVDLFFVLSGVVIANAYERKLSEGMSFTDFFVRRLIRLYPLLLLGIGFGVLNGYFGAARPELREHMVLSVALTALFLPNWVVSFSPVVGPAWSLMYELVANAVYALGLRRLTARVILAVCALSLLALVAGAVLKGHLDIGRTIKTIPFGLARVGFSFFAGVLIYRLFAVGRLSLRRPLTGMTPLLLLFLGVLILLSVRPGDALNEIYAVAAVVVAFPLIVVVGLNVEAHGAMEKVCRALGDVSYPVYVLHAPLALLIGSQLVRAGLSAPQLFAAGVAFVVAISAMSWLLHQVYDEPTRRWLNATWRGMRSRKAVAV